MGTSKVATWVAGAVVLALLLSVASWFLLISPVLATAGETRAQAVATQDSNAVLDRRIAKLAEEFDKLETTKGTLAALRQQIPTTAQLATYLRELDAVALALGVTVTSVTPSAPAAVSVDPAALAVATGGTVGAVPTVEETTSEAGAAEVEAPAPGAGLPIGFYQIPVSMTVVGHYEAVLEFLDRVQTGTPRVLLAPTVNGTAQDDTEASGGRPATSIGDLEITVTGVAYVLREPAGRPAAQDAAPLPVPAAVPGKNPLIPVG